MADSRALGLIFATLEGILEMLFKPGGHQAVTPSLPVGLDTPHIAPITLGKTEGEDEVI